MNFGQCVAALSAQLAPENTVVVAFSGGADSIAALSIVSEEAAVYGRTVIAWYLHHYNTPIEKERAHVFDKTILRARQNLGDAFVFLTDSVDVSTLSRRLGYTWEYTASLVRRKRLKRLQRHYGAAVIIGHNYSDYLETLVLRKARKIPDRALPRLSLRDTNTGFLRPLYRATRESIRDYVRDNNLEYYDDPANYDTTFARNRIRLASALDADQYKSTTQQVMHDIDFAIIHHRELHVPLATWQSLNAESRSTTQLSAFRQLGIVRKFSRNHFAQAASLPFSLAPYFAHRERAIGQEIVVFRRGLGKTLAIPHLNAHTVFGNQITRALTIALPYGHKALTKLFSERRLSPRERRRTLVRLDAHATKRVLSIQFFDGTTITAAQ
ncbi:MAG: hypothetical protein JSR44_14300 [Spirochaetes bacterium]|nr:hypothetical protein [Spirochaetota bacterium]